MKEKPILFNEQMVRAILDGRKTQTRRVLKVQGAQDCGIYNRPDGQWVYTQCGGVAVGEPFECPYGAPGDRLWVREAFKPMKHVNAKAYYRATDPLVGGKWTPSIHMPRWASRLTLEIVNVRVERVQNISEGDAKAEGVYLNSTTHWDTEARDAYRVLWDSIYKEQGSDWDTNPWVWVVEFRRL